MKTLLRLSFTCALLVLLLLSGKLVPDAGMLTTRAAGDIIYVKQGGSGNGTSWDYPLASLQQALDQAQPGDQIWVAKGVYYPEKNFYANDPKSTGFSLKNGVKIYGGFNGHETALDQRNPKVYETILSGANTFRTVVYSHGNDNTTTLDGFTISGGKNDSYAGGGMDLVGSAATFRNLVIKDNFAEIGGGGVIVYSSDNVPPVFENVEIHSNSSNGYGGGIFVNDYASAILKNVKIYNNFAIEAGGADISAASFLSNVEIYNNHAESRSGGLRIGRGYDGMFENVIIRNNTCIYCNSKGIYISQAYGVTLSNVLIYDNMPDTVRPTMNVIQVRDWSTVHLVNATIFGHTNLKEVVYVEGGSTLNITNSIFWGNSTQTVSGYVNMKNSIVQGSGGSEAWNPAYGIDLGGNLDVDPKFVDPSGRDFRLQIDSPAIDRGDNDAVTAATDLAGQPRTIGTVDLGVFETSAYDNIQIAKPALQIGYAPGESAAGVKHDLTLPSAGLLGTSVSWTSSRPDVVNDEGIVIRPPSASTDTDVTLTATISKAGVSDTKTFTLTVKKLEPVHSQLSEMTLTGDAVVKVGQPSGIKTVLKDETGNPIVSGSVTLAGAPDEGGLTITPQNVKTDVNGELAFAVSSTKAGPVTFTAAADGVDLEQTVTITFVPGDVHAGNSTVVLSGYYSVQVGMEKTIIVTLMDEYANPIPGKAVTLSADPNVDGLTIIPQGTMTDENGQLAFTVSGTKTGDVTFSASSDGVVLEQTVTITFTSGAPDALNSQIDAHPLEVAADGQEKSEITVILRDQFNNPAVDYMVWLFDDDGFTYINTVDQPHPRYAFTDSQGIARFTVARTKAGPMTIHANANGLIINDTVVVTFLPGEVHVANSIVWLEGSGTAVVGDERMIAVTLRDEYDNPIPGKTLTLSANPNVEGLEITPLGTGTDQYGGFVFVVSSTSVATVTFSVIADGIDLEQTVTITFLPGSPDADASQVDAHPLVAATDGVETSEITVTVRDSYNNPLPDQMVVLNDDDGLSDITPTQATTDEQGIARFTVTRTKAGQVTYTASAEGVTINETAVVTFLPGDVHEGNSTVVLSGSDTAVVGDERTIVVTLMDEYFNPVPGKSVSLSGDSNVDGLTITPQDTVTDENGELDFTVSSTTAADVTFTAVSDGIDLEQTVTITFLPGDVHDEHSTLTADRTVARADGQDTVLLTVHVKDLHGNPIAGRNIELIQTKGSALVDPVHDTTDSQGQAHFQVRNSTPETVTFQARDTDSAALGAPADIIFAGLLVSPDELTLIEGGQPASYHVLLNHAPADTVTVVVYGGKPLNMSAFELLFSPANWDTPQSIQLQADGLLSEEPLHVTVSHAVYSADPLFDQLIAPSVRVEIIPAEITEISVDPGEVQLMLGSKITQQLQVEAVLTNGQIADVTASHTGTIYTSSRPDIVSVTAEGLIEAHLPGNAVITVTNSGFEKQVAVRVVHQPGGESGSESKDEDDPDESEPEEDGTIIEILINGKAVKGGHVTVLMRDGREVMIVSVDPDILLKELAAIDEGVRIVLPILDTADAVIVTLDGETVKRLEQKDAVIEIRTERAVYTLPAEQIQIDTLSEQLDSDVDLEEITVEIEIGVPDEETVKAVELAAEQGSLIVIVPPLEFTVKAVYGERIVEVQSFMTYVERLLVIPWYTDVHDTATGVVVETDGTIRHVPTKMAVIDGIAYAVINSLTNSVYAVIRNPVEFADVAGHWAKDAVNDMGSRLVVNGYGEGTFRPNADVTRAEFAAMIIRALGLPAGYGNADFTDVKPADWYAGPIQTAYRYGLISGFEDGTFRPAERITREQAMVIVSNAMALTALQGLAEGLYVDEALQPYTDADDISDWARIGAARSIRGGIISGKDNGELAPQDFLTRAEAATILHRFLQQANLIDG